MMSNRKKKCKLINQATDFEKNIPLIHEDDKRKIKQN